MLGTDDPKVGSRPFVAAFTPDGTRIVVTHFRTNNISIVDVAKALAGQPAEIKRLPLVTPDGKPSRPRGVAFTKDGKYAAITGAPKGTATAEWFGWSIWRPTPLPGVSHRLAMSRT